MHIRDTTVTEMQPVSKQDIALVLSHIQRNPAFQHVLDTMKSRGEIVFICLLHILTLLLSGPQVQCVLQASQALIMTF